jgi:hypothetical protein
VTSSASIHKGERFSKTDLLSLEPEEASRRLYAHLIKRCFEGDGSDNLMSWSSSLLFVIQYAIWRSSKINCSPADIKICTVDTTKFSRGQSARDMWLTYMYPDVFSSNSDMQNLVRLREGDYDNGEYLSHGTVVHQDRSCVTSLENLIKAGLYELYPELDDPEGKEKWTNRERQLRSIWRNNSSTSQGDIRQAI